MAADTLFGERVVTVYNKTLAHPNTEYAQVLPRQCSHLAFHCRTNDEIRYAFEPGKVAEKVEPYMTLRPGVAYFIDAVNLEDASVYFAADKGGLVVEIETWS